jgi:hypothetical protein
VCVSVSAFPPAPLPFSTTLPLPRHPQFPDHSYHSFLFIFVLANLFPPSKFVVDGSWKTDDSKPSETNSQNITNNVLLPSDITPLAAASVISSAGPNATTVAMAGSVPKEESKPDVPGAFVETPGNENQTFSVNPIPATAGLGNPVKLAPGEKVPDPSTLTSNTVAGTAKTDLQSYENADAGAASQVTGGDMMSVPPVTKGMIPESSLPMGSGPAGDVNVGPFISSVGAQSTTAALAGAVPLEKPKGGDVQPFSSIGADSTTAALAGAVPLEPKDGVPEVVSESQAAAHVGPEASANAEAVAEKKEVEDELMKKVPEEPATAESGAAAAKATPADQSKAATPQKENVKPESSSATPATKSDKKKNRRSAFFSKIKKIVKGE